MKFNFAMDYHSRILWYFFAFAMGCAIYFGIPFEPNLWALVSALAICVLCFWKKRLAFFGILLFALLGMNVASIRTHLINTDMLSKPLWQQTISGFVTDSIALQDKQIITLDRVWGKKEQIPSKVRLTFYDVSPEVSNGDWIKVKAHLFPAGGVFTQRMFFQGIGARGKVLKVFEVRHKKMSVIDSVRSSIIARIKQVLPESSAQVAIPLTTGEQRVVSKETYNVYRKAGIAHILSVSGFHMALLAGFIFFFIRGFLCLIPWLALRINPKKIAAVIALIVTFCYLLLSGVQIPALRSFLMIATVLLAVLLERRAFSLYTLLLVAFAILLVRPEWIMSISFQLSFVAMMVLVSLFEQINDSLKTKKAIHWLWALVGANILIEILLMPYVMYHFNQINLYGVIGNLAVSLLFSFCVMPVLFLACLLMPFGWDAGLLELAGWVLDVIYKISFTIGNLPFADISVASFHGVGLWIITIGVGILCLLKSKKRLIGLVIIGLGFCVGYGVIRCPDMLIANDGKTILVVDNQGVAYTNQRNQEDWNLKRWLQMRGLKEAHLVKNQITVHNHKIAINTQGCDGADFAILSKKKSCPSIEVFHPDKQKTYQVFVGDEIVVEEENEDNKDRIWFKERRKK